MHPEEAERRGLTTSPASTPLRVTLGDGKEVTCNRTARLKLVFKSYTHITDAYLLDMGNAPDCTVILGTVWLATLGDYTCNEARRTLSFFNPGHRTRQKVTLTSRCQQSVRKQHDRLDVLEPTTA